MYQIYAFIKVTPSAQMDWMDLFKNKRSHPAVKNNGKRMNQGTQEEKPHHLHGSIKTMRLTLF